MMPVVHKATCWPVLTLLRGFSRSIILDPERSHFVVGAQKKIVNGPAGALIRFRTCVNALDGLKRVGL